DESVLRQIQRNKDERDDDGIEGLGCPVPQRPRNDASSWDWAGGFFWRHGCVRNGRKSEGVIAVSHGHSLPALEPSSVAHSGVSAIRVDAWTAPNSSGRPTYCRTSKRAPSRAARWCGHKPKPPSRATPSFTSMVTTTTSF